jgi:hypothetical protein
MFAETSFEYFVLLNNGQEIPVNNIEFKNIQRNRIQLSATNTQTVTIVPLHGIEKYEIFPEAIAGYKIKESVALADEHKYIVGEVKPDNVLNDYSNFHDYMAELAEENLYKEN